MDVDDNLDVDSGPVRFRSLSDVYDDSYEVELMDENVEALLIEMEEPASYREAADSQDWVDAIDREMQLSHPYFKNKIGCIKDSYVPQKQSHT